ncbi:MAG: type II CAAX endopeptidase family protein [Desulfomonilia bacterium]|nr:type II CAAX endopeptidase family protein [Desulfomonilia bacterium]
MDRVPALIIAVFVLEVISRALYPSVGIDPLLYTLAVRSIQVLAILVFAFSGCGIRAPSILRELALGCALALGIGVAVLAAEVLARLVFGAGYLPLLLAAQRPSDPWLFFVVACVAAPFAEELFFRGLFYTWLKKRLPVIGAVIVSALVFASAHGVFSPVQLAGGILFAVVYEWRGSIWAAFVIHGLGNLGIWIVPLIASFLGISGW